MPIYQVSKWLDRIQRTGKIYKKNQDEFTRFKKAYSGDFRDKDNRPNGRHNINVNFVYYFIESIMPAIFNGEPKIVCKPKPMLGVPFELSEKNSYINQNNVNYWFKELDAKSEFADCIFDRFMGIAALYTGWQFEVFQDEKGEEKVDKDQPLIRWLDFYKDIRVDPDCKKLRYARWMAIRVTLPYEEFLEVKGIKDKFKFGDDKLVPEVRPDEDNKEDRYRSQMEKRSDAEWVNYWEVWDRQNMKRFLVHESRKEEYLNEDFSWPYEFEYKNDPFPVTFLMGKRDSETNLSISEFKPIEDQIWERNRNRSVQAAVVKRIAPRYMYSKKSATNAQIAKFQGSDMLTMNEFNDPSGVILAPKVEIPPTFFQWDSVLAEDLGNTSGLSEFENNKLANTATEASISEGRADVRKSKMVEEIEEFIVTVGAKVAGLCAQLQNRTKTIAISPEETESGEWEQIVVTKDSLQGEFDYEMIAGQMEHVNEALLRQEATRFLEVAKDSGEINVRNFIRDIAPYYRLNPRKILLTDEEKAAMAPPPEPTIMFDKVKIEELMPADRIRVIEEAKKQNEVKNLSPGPMEAAMQQAQAGPQVPNPNEPQGTVLPMNDTKNMAGNQNPQVPVHPNSLTPKR